MTMRFILALIALAAMVVISLTAYRCFNIGLSPSARHQQTSRFVIASVLAVLPMTVAEMHVGIALWGLALITLTCLAWMVTFAMLAWLSNRGHKSDLDNYMDIAFGLYMFGIMSALWLVGGPICSIVIALAEICMLVAVVVQLIYYLMYKIAIDVNGMRIIRDTNVNEVIEFTRYYPLYQTLSAVLAIVVVIVGIVWLNIQVEVEPLISQWQLIVLAGYCSVMCFIAFAGKRSPFRRTGLMTLWLNVGEFRRLNKEYKDNAGSRRAKLQLERLGARADRPSTILMVIGESGNRDYMKVFNEKLRYDSTPWMSSLDKSIIFKNAYSCDMHTVQVLERSLTESNQYNGIRFIEAVSIVDVAKKLGYRVHWYSNQGHIGVFDTPISLLAETSDVAKWTEQHVGHVVYDHDLINFLDEVDPAVDNFVVLHLKGSHFNYLNRYPASATVWGSPGVQDDELNYINSIRYTDSVLKEAFEYCKEKLNLQAMIYFSDHGSDPLRHRSPGFNGFGNVRIPLMVWLSDEYRRCHPERVSALMRNTDKFFTNDLAYELMCGVFDIAPCEHFDASASIAYDQYRFERDELMTFSGKIKISDDTTDDEPVL